MEDNYTGRVIGIFTDAHGLLEPTMAVLEDMKKRGIVEIYSLGDNIGVGPNPSEVMNLLEEYGVQSIAGNSEEYVNLGVEPFSSYFNSIKTASHLWTLSKLNEDQIGKISLFPKSIELLLGEKKIALCHFANDIRFDFSHNSTWAYQNAISSGKPGYNQFFYTNSSDQITNLYWKHQKNGDISEMGGIISAQKKPLFDGKMVDRFNALIQGHVHWKIYEQSCSTSFYSIRAVGMAYGKDPLDSASYVTLREKLDGGYDFEEMLVRYDREKMKQSILKSDSPDYTIENFVSINR